MLLPRRRSKQVAGAASGGTSSTGVRWEGSPLGFAYRRTTHCAL